DPTNCLLTGMTRDGAWLVEDGKVVSAVKNFYFSETPVYVLEQVEALSFSERVSPRNSLFPMRVPGMKVPGFSFIGVTDIV
ncbi:MAG: TldD/PmbA family protein, partial [Chlorobi bacterium]|nr:TldD/PmbA family protein [Chlorobiota bacterium]